jgi:hypothetical protein
MQQVGLPLTGRVALEGGVARCGGVKRGVVCGGRALLVDLLPLGALELLHLPGNRLRLRRLALRPLLALPLPPVVRLPHQPLHTCTARGCSGSSAHLVGTLCPTPPAVVDRGATLARTHTCCYLEPRHALALPLRIPAGTDTCSCPPEPPRWNRLTLLYFPLNSPSHS